MKNPFGLLNKTRQHDSELRCDNKEEGLLERIVNSVEYNNLQPNELLDWMGKQLPENYISETSQAVRQLYYSKVLSEAMPGADLDRYRYGGKLSFESAIGALENDFFRIFRKGRLFRYPTSILDEVKEYSERYSAVLKSMDNVDELKSHWLKSKTDLPHQVLLRVDANSEKMRKAIKAASITEYRKNRTERYSKIYTLFHDLKGHAKCTDAKILHMLKDIKPLNYDRIPQKRE